MANFETVPLFIRERKGDDTENLELSLIENIIRQDLNPIEEAEALYRLEKEYKQDVLSIAKLVGKDSSSVKNCIRLLKLPEPVKQDIREGRLSSGHGKVLLSLEDQPEDLMQCRAVILSKSLTVRQTEVLTKKVNNKYGKRPISRMKEERTIYFETLERLVSEALNGLKVEIIHEGRKKKIIINYNTLESIEAFLQKLDITIPS
jgi:ParB family chromosome partitioning protein